MFSGSSEKQNFLKRTASHSTKPRANGRVDILPPQARELETVYAESKDQWLAVEKIAEGVKAEIQGLKADPGFKYKAWKIEKVRELEQTLHSLSDTRSRLAEAARAAGLESYGWTFMCLAELRLTKELFRQIDEETTELVGRKRSEVKRPAGLVNRERRAERRAKFISDHPS